MVAFGRSSRTSLQVAQAADQSPRPRKTTETESANTVTPVLEFQLVSVGKVTETETAQVVSIPAYGRVSRVSLQVAIAAPQEITVTVISETETAVAVAIVADQSIGVGTVTETETAQLVTPLYNQSITVTTITETETSQSVSNGRYVSVGVTTETESAISVTAIGLNVLVLHFTQGGMYLYVNEETRSPLSLSGTGFKRGVRYGKNVSVRST